MRKAGIILCVLFIYAVNATGQGKLLTKAENSDFRATSDYEDVMKFISELEKSSRYIRVEKIATSIEGKDVPLLVIADPLPATPKDLANDKRVVVYIQANIHAGEVEGKEASLMFARDLLNGKNAGLLKNVVLLICPNFNPDGNEKISKNNRTDQNGPVNGVGVRYNGQFLDLNRDGMKAESPEVRGVLTNVFNKWDPYVFMDCHTTDGSFHVEPVTFTWMVNPNGDNGLISYMKGKMMPSVSGTLLKKYNVENCFYGEFIDMLKPEKGWVLDASEPRYMSNYAGIRNRLGILNENYIYADYKSRVYGCYYLINSLLDYVSANTAEIKKLIHDTDAKTTLRGLNPSIKDSFAIEYEVRPLPEKVTIQTFEAEPAGESNGWPEYRKTENQIDVTVPYYVDYHPTKSVKLPYAYILSVPDPDIIEVLKLHGLRIEKLAVSTRISVESFELTDLKSSQRLNQGHYTNTIKGRYSKVEMSFPAGTVVIRTAQPLANVASYLLEAQSNDGLVAWNFFDKYLVPQWGRGYNPFPVYKLMERTELKTIE